MAASPGNPSDKTPPEADADATQDAKTAEVLKEAWQATLGALGSAEEETHALLGRLVGLGKLNREDGARMFNDVLKLVETRRNELEDRVNKSVLGAMKRLTIPTREELSEVAQKLAELERRVEALDDATPPPPKELRAPRKRAKAR
ncbi:MAG: phasin family protein [Myxococcota bacterium]